MSTVDVVNTLYAAHKHKHTAVRAQPVLKNNDRESEEEGERRRRRKQMILEDLEKNTLVRPGELKRESSV